MNSLLIGSGAISWKRSFFSTIDLVVKGQFMNVLNFRLPKLTRLLTQKEMTFASKAGLMNLVISFVLIIVPLKMNLKTLLSPSQFPITKRRILLAFEKGLLFSDMTPKGITLEGFYFHIKGFFLE